MPMSLDAYVEHVRDLLDGVPELRFRRMFGGVGVYSGPQMFALVVGEQLYLKTDPDGRVAYAAAGSEPFVFDAARGPTTTSYWRIPAAVEEQPGEAARWAMQALEAAHRAKQPKRRAAPVHDLGPGPWDE